MPVTGSDLYGREEDIAFLDRAWANKDVNVVTIVAWAETARDPLSNRIFNEFEPDRVAHDFSQVEKSKAPRQGRYGQSRLFGCPSSRS